MIDLYSEIRRRYGNIRRARGYYLYTEKNIRLLDLWLDGGKAILGRRSGQANLACKQLLDRGLTGSLPTKADRQLKDALSALLPGYPVIRWYVSEERSNELIRAALAKSTHDELPVWRPFLGVRTAKTCSPSSDTVDYPIISVTPVYPVSYGIIAAQQDFEDRLPPSDPLFPPLAYSLARAFFDVQHKIRKQQDSVPLGGTSKAGSTRNPYAVRKQESNLTPLLPYIWEQNSRYLFPQIAEEDYPQLFSEALDARIVLSPDYHIPSILPDCGTYTELLKFLKTRIAE
ncbi:MAG: hypothetical protein P1P65_04245 [Treponema sp.]